jgi:GNAT superfamily N-acetyltransferase
LEERAALEGLAARCGEEAWKHGGVELEEDRAVYGCFVDGEMVSAASYDVWGGVIAHVGVVTDPGHRGHGFAKSVAVAAVGHALDNGLVPQWRTLASNAASVGVGRAIGFEGFAEHYFVRLSAAGE